MFRQGETIEYLMLVMYTCVLVMYTCVLVMYTCVLEVSILPFSTILELFRQCDIFVSDIITYYVYSSRHKCCHVRALNRDWCLENCVLMENNTDDTQKSWNT
jgi:hypothetical protein